MKLDATKKKILAVFIVFNIILIGYVVLFGDKSKESDKKIHLSDLTYSIDYEFKNIVDESTSKTYRYGDTCEVRISYGIPSGDNPIDKYFEGVKDSLSSEKEAQFKRDSFNLNGNTWQVLEVQFFVNDRMNEKGYEIKTKYKYSSIVYDKNIYHIGFYNPDYDAKCEEKYNDFQKSLSFD